MTPPPSSPRATLLRALAGLATAVLVLLSAEGALFALGLPDPGLYTGDPRTVWWLRPGLDRRQPFPAAPSGAFSIQTGDLGLRGPHAPPPPGADQPWTLALGCSTTFGWGVEAEQAWPALLAEEIGEPVVNGGVPGWSTHQALRGAERYLALRPRRVLLGYIVRDAQPALLPDAASTPTPLLQRTRLFRFLRFLQQRLRPARHAGGGGELPTTRVPPEEYRENLAALLALVPAEVEEVWLLSFPQPQPDGLGAWREAMRQAGRPVLEPSLPAGMFFADDPIHLTAEGNRALARLLAERLGSGGR